MAVFLPLLALGAAGLLRTYQSEKARRRNKQYISPKANRTNTLGGKPATGLEDRMRFGSEKPVFAYPIDIDVDQDHIQISQYKYKRPGTGAGAREGSHQRANASAPGASTAGMQFEGTVVLPMPKVSDSNAANWGKSEMDVYELMKLQAAGIGLGAGQRGLDERQEQSMGGGFLGSNQNNLGGGPTRGQKGEYFWQNLPLPFLAKRVEDAIGGNVTADNALGRSRGQIMNPNAELLFQGTNLRQFGFKWQMVARSQREGQMIRQIIRKFKIGAAPKFNNTALMEFPDIFHIKYMKGRNELMTANRFEQLALTSITVDYAPDGTWTTYDDSQPISIRMTLDFKELRPIWRTHHEKFAPEMSVGY
tara:strand:- start:704 stop:1792 length:1089 start_codon:yes stop_codon:yes gene_type:complete